VTAGLLIGPLLTLAVALAPSRAARRHCGADAGLANSSSSSTG